MQFIGGRHLSRSKYLDQPIKGKSVPHGSLVWWVPQLHYEFIVLYHNTNQRQTSMSERHLTGDPCV
jgi:hypothetical protein